MSDPLEMARCVEINIENMVSMMPVLKKHPLLGVVRLQIKECVEALEAAEHSVEADALPCGHNQGIEFGESSWSCVVCGQPVRRSR